MSAAEEENWEQSADARLAAEAARALDLNAKDLNVGAFEFVPSAAAFEFVPAGAGGNDDLPPPQQQNEEGEESSEDAPVAPARAAPAPAAPAPANLTKTAAAAAAAPAAPKSAPAKNANASAAGSKASSAASAAPATATVEELSQEAQQNMAALFSSNNAEDGTKEHLNVIFIGHVDAGKSTMGGQILLLTEMVDKRTMEKIEKEAKDAGRESWYLSWALDTNKEEREQGKTVECGKAHFELANRRFTLLDAPGHKSYVPSMISGAAQADVAILVISARKGEFETGFERGGQTREHAMLAKTAGVKRLICAVNKMDDPTVQWSKERYDECVSKITPYLRGAGYNPKSDLDFMPISGYTGANMKDRLDPKVCSWYSGPSLLEHLDTLPMIIRKYDAPLLLPIIEKYKDMGTVIEGKIEAGVVRKGDQIMIMPNKSRGEVVSVFEDEEELKMAKCGDNVKLRLKGIEEDEVLVGMVLSDYRFPVKMASVFEADLVIMDYKNIICAGFSCVMHIHTAVQEVTISALLNMIDKKTKKRTKKPPVYLKSHQFARVRFVTSPSICIETYKEHPQLGRFTLREEQNTIAMGKVTKLLE